MRTLADIEQDILDAYRCMTEHRDVGDEGMARHYERCMNVKLDELSLRLPIVVV